MHRKLSLHAMQCNAMQCNAMQCNAIHLDKVEPVHGGHDDHLPLITLILYVEGMMIINL